MRIVPSMGEHPIRILYDHGVKVTVNSDDVILFGQSVSQEFLNLYQSGCLNADALEEIRGNGLSS
jgi:adenosine deaminase